MVIFIIIFLVLIMKSSIAGLVEWVPETKKEHVVRSPTTIYAHC
jgi:hypothetical protein